MFPQPLAAATTAPTSDGSKIDVINGLRGFAILLVVYFHSLTKTIEYRFNLDWIIGNGWIGVNLFFILSGFVLYKPYYTGKRTFGSTKEVNWFFYHRVTRLYPLFLLNCLVALLFTGPVTVDKLESFVLTLTTLGVFTPGHFMPLINAVLWTLMIEIWFSLVFPLLAWSFEKFGSVRASLVVFLLALGIRCAGAGYEWTLIHVNPIKDSFLGRLDDFVTGMLLLQWYYRTEGFRHLNRRSVWLIGLISMAALLLACLLWDFRERNTLPLYVVPFLNNLIQVGFAGITVVALREGNLFHSLFRLKALQLCGLMCFSLYVWHMLMLWVIQLPLPGLVNYLLYLLFLFALSAVTYRFVEFGHVKNGKALFLT